MFYMEEWPLGYMPLGIKSRHYQRVTINNVSNHFVFIRVDTHIDETVDVRKTYVTIVNGKMKCGDYTGVHICNEGIIRWFSNMKVFDNPIFKWVPVDDPCYKVKKLMTDVNHVMVEPPPTPRQTTNNRTVLFELSKAEWPALTA